MSEEDIEKYRQWRNEMEEKYFYKTAQIPKGEYKPILIGEPNVGKELAVKLAFEKHKEFGIHYGNTNSKLSKIMTGKTIEELSKEQELSDINQLLSNTKEGEQLIEQLKEVGTKQFFLEERQKQFALKKKHQQHTINQKALLKKSKKKRKK